MSAGKARTRGAHRRWTAVAALVAAALAGGAAPSGATGPTPRPAEHWRAVAAPQAAATGDGFVPLAPTRILDTRTGLGAPVARVGAGGSVTVQVGGRGGVPASGVAAVVVNLTAVAPTAGTFLAAYPGGTSRPATSNVSVPKGVTTASSAVVGLGAGGTVTIYNGAGTLDVLADVSGYFTSAASTYRSVAPMRLLDTRIGLGGRTGALPVGGTVTVTVGGKGGVPGSGVAAVVGTLTVVTPTEATYASAYATGTPRPGVSSVNAPAGRTVANSVIVRLGTGGAVTLFNAAGSAHLLLDVVGYLTTGGGYVAVAPLRVSDTRSDQAPLTPGEQRAFRVTNTGSQEAGDSIPTSGIAALVVNVTAVRPTSATYLGTGPSVVPITTSTVNTTAGVTASNLAVVKVGAGGMIDVLNSRGTTGVVIDVVGWFTSTRTPAVEVGASVGVSTARDGATLVAGVPAAVSVDGRYVLFSSEDGRIVPRGEVKNGSNGVYLRDAALGWTADVWGFDGGPGLPTGMSATGEVIAFDADVPWLGKGSLLLAPFAGLYGTASVDAAGSPANGRSAAVSTSGRWLTYVLNADQLVVRDVTSGTAPASVGRVCARAADCTENAVSDDGRYVTYRGPRPGVTSAQTQVVQFDKQAGTFTVVSAATDGTPGDADAVHPSASADGRYVAFESAATNLVEGDTNGVSDVFVKDVRTGAVRLVSQDRSGGPADGASGLPSISADGTAVAFTSRARDLQPGVQPSMAAQVYVRTLATGAIALGSRTASGAPGDADSGAPKLSATGTWVAYTTLATNLVSSSNGRRVAVLTRLG